MFHINMFSSICLLCAFFLSSEIVYDRIFITFVNGKIQGVSAANETDILH